ncbi:recombinase family protein, partial [Leisingera sp. MMG025]|nr:recombinase family protein [Leisingera sp. MMG026]
MRLFDQETKQFEQDRANLLRAVKNGLHSDAIISELNAVDAKLERRRAEREALVPAPIELPEDLPALYRDFIANITDTLSDEGVAGRASDELHALLDQVIITWNADERSHDFEMQGDLLELIGKPHGKSLGGDADLESSLK